MTVEDGLIVTSVHTTMGVRVVSVRLGLMSIQNPLRKSLTDLPGRPVFTHCQCGRKWSQVRPVPLTETLDVP